MYCNSVAGEYPVKMEDLPKFAWVVRTIYSVISDALHGNSKMYRLPLTIDKGC